MDNFLYVEKYRPQKIEDCILSENIKNIFHNLVKKGEIINLLLSGSPGTGKTTVAKALCNELNADYIIINGSDERNIDTLRGKIKNFVSTVSTNGKTKVVIIDEADYLNPTSTQPALRNFIEEFSKNARFILTCNYKHKIIPPLHSRCSVVDFSISKSDKPSLAKQLAIRCFSILDTEGIEYSKEAVIEVIKHYFPDFRRIINELQRYSQVSGSIDSGIIATVNTSKIQTLIGYIKNNDFKSARQWIADNPDPDSLFNNLYENITDYVDGPSIPNLVLIMGEYQHRAAFATNQEINMAAFIVELIKNVKFKV